MTSLQGDLAEYPLPDIIQFFHATRKRGQLLFEQPDTKAAAGLYFHSGEIVHAFCPPQVGEEAFFRLFRWKQGKFVFLKGQDAPTRTMHSSVQNLLLEGLRRMDEADHFELLPDRTLVLHVERDAAKVGDVKLTAKEWKLISLINGKRSIQQVIDLFDDDQRELSQLMYGLLMSGVLTEIFDETFLSRIYLERIPADQAPRIRGAPPSILSNLVLREIDGRVDLLTVRKRLNAHVNDFIEEVRLLMRTDWVRAIAGHDDVRRYL